jgi:hypothetical protein
MSSSVTEGVLSVCDRRGFLFVATGGGGTPIAQRHCRTCSGVSAAATTAKVTGVERERLIGTDFSDYFTEPERAREGYRRVFAEGSVTDYPLTIRHRDGGLTDVLGHGAALHKEPKEPARTGPLGRQPKEGA